MGVRKIHRAVHSSDVVPGMVSDRRSIPAELTRRQHFSIREDDLGLYLGAFTTPGSWGSDWATEWRPVVYDREWSDSGMTYHDVNCIAASGGDENFQLFSSRRVYR